MTGANVARAMQLSAPTVHEMIGRLERDGYVTRGGRQGARLHRQRARARRGHRPPPPADRALPHRRPRHPVGRGPRGGRAARARDVAGAGGAHARRDRRREDVPARASDQRRRADRRRAAGDVEVGAKIRSCASRTRPRTCCTTSRTPGIEPGEEGAVAETRRRRTSSIDFGGAHVRAHPLGRRDGLGDRRPVAAAAHGAARAARALQGPLRALRSSRGRGSRRTSAVRSPRATSPAQAVERVPDVDVARVERRDAEPDRVGPAEVGRRRRRARSARG